MRRLQTSPKAEKRQHPYADATYRIFGLDGGAFGIEVSIPDAEPAKVTRFPTRSAAHRWIENHKAAVARQGSLVARPGYVRSFAGAKARPPKAVG